MPYIKKENREKIEVYKPKTPGELNYLISIMADNYTWLKGESYQTYNDIIGALECAKQEFYRRLIAPYEDLKCIENGDVFI